MGVSRERVRQIQTAAIMKMRAVFMAFESKERRESRLREMMVQDELKWHLPPDESDESDEVEDEAMPPIPIIPMPAPACVGCGATGVILCKRNGLCAECVSKARVQRDIECERERQAKREEKPTYATIYACKGCGLGILIRGFCQQCLEKYPAYQAASAAFDAADGVPLRAPPWAAALPREVRNALWVLDEETGEYVSPETQARPSGHKS